MCVCVCVCQCVCVCVCLSVCLSECLSVLVYTCICLAICLLLVVSIGVGKKDITIIVITLNDDNGSSARLHVYNAASRSPRRGVFHTQHES